MAGKVKIGLVGVPHLRSQRFISPILRSARGPYTYGMYGKSVVDS